jgi:hypothetical protein
MVGAMISGQQGLAQQRRTFPVRQRLEQIICRFLTSSRNSSCMLRIEFTASFQALSLGGAAAFGQ